jgi:glycosyltransferase involved in cell wall biosynthesis
MKSIYIPSIKAQKNKNFKIGFIIKEEHVKFLKEFFGTEAEYFKSFSEAKQYCVKNNFDIQTRHDCDDWMNENYIERIQQVYNENKDKYDKFLIHSQVHKLNYQTNEIYLHNIPYWGDKSNSGFISSFLTLCQKNVDTFVFNGNHVKMNESTTSNIIYLNENLVRLTVHGNNIYSKIREHDVKIGILNNNFDITLVVPAFESYEFLEEFLESVKRAVKNYKVEVLIGIDSCQKTRNFVINKKLHIGNFFKFYFFDKNVGPYVVRNTLGNLSNSDNILFIDSDDILHEDIISKTIESLKVNDIIRYKFYNFNHSKDLKNFNTDKINQFHSIGQLGIRKNIFLSLNGFEPWSCAADSEFMMRETANKFKVKKTNEILYYRRRHENSITSRKETDYRSKIRSQYNQITDKKRKNNDIGKLKNLSISNCYRIDGNSKLILEKDGFKLVIVSTFWNAEKYVANCIKSLKNQNHFNFLAYFVDDMSSDNSYEEAKKTIGDDDRFVLIKNNTKKYKTKNFIDVIRDNPKINWDDVIIEIDGDDKLKDKHVLSRINKVFSDNNIWLCGTKWVDTNGRIGNYGKPNPEKARSSSWNFSHMRSYRAFLFRSIQDEHLKFKGEYFKAACDLGFGIPMLEMSGSEHFYYIDEPLYVYTWHDKQSYSNNNSFGDKTVQGRTAKYIYSLPKYEPLNIEFEYDFEPEITPEIRLTNIQILNNLLYNNKDNKFEKKRQVGIDYEKLNKSLHEQGVYDPKKNIPKPKTTQNKPEDRHKLIQIKKESNVSTLRSEMPSKPNRRKITPNIFSSKNYKKRGE